MNLSTAGSARRDWDEHEVQLRFAYLSTIARDATTAKDHRSRVAACDSFETIAKQLRQHLTQGGTS